MHCCLLTSSNLETKRNALTLEKKFSQGRIVYCSGRKNVMSMRELFCPHPLTGFEKMAGFQIFYCLKIRCCHSKPGKNWHICLQKLQAVVITLSLLNFLEEYLIVKRTLTTSNSLRCTGNVDA